MSDKKVLVLRSSDRDRRAYGGFQYPESGMVEAPDWKPTKECGKGLHGLLWGLGDYSLYNWDEDAVWQVLEVLEADLICLGGKVKFPRAEIVCAGSREKVWTYLMENGGAEHGAQYYTSGNHLVKEGRVFASGSASVEAWGSASVEAWGSASVRAWGSASVRAWDSASVRAWDSASVRAWDSASVEAWDSASVEAWGSASVEAWGSASVEAWGSASVRASMRTVVISLSARVKVTLEGSLAVLINRGSYPWSSVEVKTGDDSE